MGLSIPAGGASAGSPAIELVDSTGHPIASIPASTVIRGRDEFTSFTAPAMQRVQRAKLIPTPRVARQPSASAAHRLHPLGLPLLHLLRREIFLVRRDRPRVPVRIGERSAAIAPELIRHRPMGPVATLRARRDGAVEQRVAVLHVEPERRRRSAERLWAPCRPSSRRSA